MSAGRAGAGRAPDRADARAVVPEGTVPPSGIPADVFAGAVDAYVSGQRLDMQSLARRASVGRATLYRRVGNREQLLDEVIWWRARGSWSPGSRPRRGWREWPGSPR